MSDGSYILVPKEEFNRLLEIEERTIPKRVVVDDMGTVTCYSCPDCGGIIVLSIATIDRIKKIKFCQYCGQMLKWDEAIESYENY